MGVLITHDLKKKMIYCNLRHGAFGKSKTPDETIYAVRGVPSSLTPCCNPMFFLGPFSTFCYITPVPASGSFLALGIMRGLPCFSWSYSVYLTWSVLVILLAFAMGVHFDWVR